MDYRKVCQQIVKYLISGMTVAFAAFFIPRRQMNLEEIIMISFTAAASFAVLEHYAPSLYQPSLFGSGFGIGANNVGFEGFITRIRYQPNAINPQEAYNIYKEGISASLAKSIYNKYGLKVSFLEYDQERGSFTI